MTSNKPPKTFHIFYAWAEGPWFGKKTSAELKKAGFLEAPINEATVLIAHSVGTYLVRPRKSNKVTILIGPPYYPGKSVRVSISQKRKHDRKNLPFLEYIHKLLWNIFYIISKPLVTLRAGRVIYSEDPLSKAGSNSIVIQNDDDAFCAPNLNKLIKQRVVKLPGQHDDCWFNPVPYVK
ncbi:MAG: hypothetical protein WDN66_05885 [Candidatus Saccharibacteria bacterium]